VWCRPKTLGRENQEVEWKEGLTDGNYRCSGWKDRAEDNCGCIDVVCVL